MLLARLSWNAQCIRVHIIPNGYDGAIDSSPVPRGERCTILYTGTLISYRYDTLLEAVREFRQRDPARADACPSSVSAKAESNSGNRWSRWVSPICSRFETRCPTRDPRALPHRACAARPGPPFDAERLRVVRQRQGLRISEGRPADRWGPASGRDEEHSGACQRADACRRGLAITDPRCPAANGGCLARGRPAFTAAGQRGLSRLLGGVPDEQHWPAHSTAHQPQNRSSRGLFRFRRRCGPMSKPASA